MSFPQDGKKIPIPQAGEMKSEFLPRCERLLIEDGESQSDAMESSQRIWTDHHREYAASAIASEKKGDEGPAGNGAKARSLISQLERKGFSQVEIAKATGRSRSVIVSIKNGTIKNPPSSLLSSLRSMLSRKKK